MRVEEFVAALAKAAPTEKELRALGLTKAEAKELIASFNAPKRRKAKTGLTDLATIGQLLSVYDCRKLAIGTVRFPADPERRDGAWIVGRVEADPLVVGSSGDVWVEELGVPHHVLWRCAANADGFLNAIAICAEFLGKAACNEGPTDDTQLLESVINRCIKYAGGRQYEAFYRVLIE